MWDLILGSLWGWIGTAGVIVIACVVVGWLIPQSRPYVIALGAAAIWTAGAFTKGYAARGQKEQERRDAAVKKLGGEYDQIEKNTDPDRARGRLRDGSL